MPQLKYESLDDMVCVPHDMDFFRPSFGPAPKLLPAPDHLLGTLKETTLFFGRLLIPMEYLLFNEAIFDMWSSPTQRPLLEQFLKEGRPIVSIGNEVHRNNFIDRRASAIEAGNPAVRFIETSEGERFAGALASVPWNTDTITFSTVKALETYPDIFRKEAACSNLDPELCEQVLELAVQLTLEDRRATQKASIDGVTSVTPSRGGIMRIFRESTDFRAFKLLRLAKGPIWNCAHLAYARTVASNLTRVWQDSLAVTVHDEQRERAVIYETREPDAFLAELRARSHDLFPIDWGALHRAHWAKIVAYSQSDPANLYFQCRRNLYYEQSKTNFDELVKALREYARFLASKFPLGPSLPPTLVRACKLGSYILLGLAEGFLTSGLPRRTLAVILASRHEVEQKMEGRRHRKRQAHRESELGTTQRVVARQFYREDHGTSRHGASDKGDGMGSA